MGHGVACADDKLIVDMEEGSTILVPLVWYPRQLHELSSQRHNWEPGGGGSSIHWPDIDEDLSVKGLLSGAPAPQQRAVIV